MKRIIVVLLIVLSGCNLQITPTPPSRPQPPPVRTDYPEPQPPCVIIAGKPACY